MPATFADAAASAATTLETAWFAGDGWHECLHGCRTTDSDWGADSLTYALYLHWKRTGDARAVSIARAVLARVPRYGAPCRDETCKQWSDVPMWDAIAALRLGEIAGRPAAGLALARRAFAMVDGTDAYARGACPDVSYQQPYGHGNHLKTLETDSNYVKAALLLYRASGERAYLGRAVARYRAARAHFLEPANALYTTYLFDGSSGSGGPDACTPLQGRYFASVNGNMIWNGLELAAETGNAAYRAEALATARAVATRLADATGIFEDLQAENDIVGPLVEAMLRLAREESQGFARDWILRNARAAGAARTPGGSFGRFFGGPAPRADVTAWQTNGAFALATAAAELAPLDGATLDRTWLAARFVPFANAGLPAQLRFRGSAIALVGTLGARCCEAGHARVFVDGRETFDRTGIWQNKSSSGRALPHTILFAWRWPASGPHVLEFLPGSANAKEGDAYLQLAGYYLAAKGAAPSPANRAVNSSRHD